MNSFETPRLKLVPFHEDFTAEIFKLHSNPLVHKYLQNNMISSFQEAEEIVQGVIQQYHLYQMGRYLVFEKSTSDFMGWCGLKFNTHEINGYKNYHDIGYRFLPQFWNKGYAFESAQFFVQLGYSHYQLPQIFATAECENTASVKILKKCGLSIVETFDFHHKPTFWFEGQNPSKEIKK